MILITAHMIIMTINKVTMMNQITAHMKILKIKIKYPLKMIINPHVIFFKKILEKNSKQPLQVTKMNQIAQIMIPKMTTKYLMKIKVNCLITLKPILNIPKSGVSIFTDYIYYFNFYK